MRALKTAGLRKFDAYAHHPYYGRKTESPSTKPSATAVTMGNINTLIAQLTLLWGNKRLWITEYGYQTNPPDRAFGVSYAQQAAYMKQAYAMARKNPRIDMMLWFLLRDEPRLGGWQSGLSDAHRPEEAGVQRLSPAPARLVQAAPARSGASAAAPTTTVTIVRSPDQTSARSTGIVEIQ